MSRTRWRAAAVVAATVSLTLGTLAVPLAASASAVRPDVTVRVDSHGVAHVPSRSLRPGRIHFVVTGAKGEEFQLARAQGGSTVATLLADNDTLNSTGIPVDLERDFTLYGGASVGESFWVTLPPGRYFAVDANQASLTRAQVGQFMVTGGYADATLPRITGEISAVKDMSWSGYPASIKRRGVMEFNNSSTDTHFIVLAQLQPGATLHQVKKLIADENADPSKVLTGVFFSSGVISPNQQNLLSYQLPAGTYALVCFWPDENGVEHAKMGMVRLISLT